MFRLPCLRQAREAGILCFEFNPSTKHILYVVKIKKIIENNYVVFFVTASSRQEAEKISLGLLEAKLAACVNIIKDVHSFFWWKGKIDRAKEALLVVKTRKALAAKLIKKVRTLHSYDVPEIIALPIIDGNKEYLDWLNDSTGQSY